MTTRFSREYGAKLAAAQDKVRRLAIDKAADVANDSHMRAPDNFEFVGFGHRPRISTKPKGKSIFPGLCVAAGYPRPAEEYQFHPTRKWRFDYAWPNIKLALEVEGGIFIEGRHTRGAGMLEDMRKYSAAALLGWRIIYYTPSDLGLAIIDLRGVFN